MDDKKMPPGRELDALIAEMVMGISLVPIRHPARAMSFSPGSVNYGAAWTEYPDPKSYSTDIAAAWAVVEKITREKRDGMGWFDLRFTNGRYQATFVTGAYYEARDHVQAETAPHAICLAALKAVGG